MREEKERAFLSSLHSLLPSFNFVLITLLFVTFIALDFLHNYCILYYRDEAQLYEVHKVTYFCSNLFLDEHTRTLRVSSSGM
jgi:hypothetical protein